METELNKTLMAIQKDLTEISASTRSAHKRLDEQQKLINSVHELAASVRVMAAELSHIKCDVKDTQTQIDTLEGHVTDIREKPAKRWDNAVSHVITLLIGAAFAYFMAKIGK